MDGNQEISTKIIDKEDDNNIIKTNNNQILSISNSYIIKSVLKYQSISHVLKLLKNSKSLQKYIGISLTTYKIFHFYKKNKINMFDFKKLIKFSQNIKSKLKECSSLKEIYYDLSICMIDNFFNNNSQKNNIDIIDINMLYEDLFIIYKPLLQHFSSSFKINLFYSDKFFIDKKYLETSYQKFVLKNKNFIYGVSFELYDKNIIEAIINNKYVFANNVFFDSSFCIKRIKFSKIKFRKDEMNLLELFPIGNISELYFFSCKFTLNSIDILSRFLFNAKKHLTKLIFNDCHINNNIINKLIFCDENNLENSFNKSILYSLEKLDLSNNKIADLGFNQLLLYFNSKNELYKRNLSHLNLSNNKLSLQSIKYLLDIYSLFMNKNISNQNQIILKDLNGIEKLNGLTYLDLSHNSLGEYAKLIFSWKNKTLTHLILIDCNIRNISNEKYVSNYMNIDEDMEEEEDKKSTSEISSYSNSEIECFDEDDIALGLNNLIYLNVSQNQIFPKFLKFLFYNIPKLYTIFISSCFLDNNSFSEIMNLKKGVNIQRLILSHNAIDTLTIINLYECGILKNIKELDLFDNNLKDNIVPFLIKIKDSIKLEKINIDLNYGIERSNNSLLYQNYIRYTK